MRVDLRTRLEGLAGEEPDSQPLPHGEPIPRVAPADERLLCELLHWAASEHLRVLPTGAGSRLGWLPPIDADFALSTERLTGIVAHEAADGTLTARAGTPLVELRVAAARQGHEFSPVTDRGTLGGALACADPGQARMRTGPPRDHLLGARLALTDRSVARSGGRLVKNVTGYDLHRLAVGARGSTGVLLEGTLRLLTAPERRVVLTGRFDELTEGINFVLGRLRGSSPARYARLRRGADGWTLEAQLGGGAAAIDETLSALERAVDGLVVRSRESDGPEPARSPAAPQLIARTRPSRLLQLWNRLEVGLAQSGLDPFVGAEPALGELHLSFSGLAIAPALELTTSLAEADDGATRLTWRDLPPATSRDDAAALHASARAHRPEPPLAARVRRALDPLGVLAR
jgi:hypothetical protein